MGGREWRGSRIRPRAASDVLSRIVAALEEPFTATAVGNESEAQSGAGKVVIEGVSRGLCSVVFLFSETALEEPFRMAEGG
jgi:hypothetical protein